MIKKTNFKVKYKVQDVSRVIYVAGEEDVEHFENEICPMFDGFQEMLVYRECKDGIGFEEIWCRRITPPKITRKMMVDSLLEEGDFSKRVAMDDYRETLEKMDYMELEHEFKCNGLSFDSKGKLQKFNFDDIENV